MTLPHPGLPTLEALAADPSTALSQLADHVSQMHLSMHPGDVLELRLDSGVMVMGRHEVPALALLFRHHAATPEAGDEARRRAEALLRDGRIRPDA
jgi:hypothetical protein